MSCGENKNMAIPDGNLKTNQPIIPLYFFHLFIIFFTVLLVLMGCSESLPVKATTTDQISQANWNDNTQVLSITGKATGEQSSLTVTNDVTNEKVGVASVQKDKTWQVILSKPAMVPCSVGLSDGGGAVNVANAPTHCNQLTRESIDVNLGRSVTQSVYPEGTITSPANDMTVAPGGVIEFAALGSESGLRYQWEISSGAFNYSSKAQNPGFLKFSQPGNYRVQLTVSNTLGIKDLMAEQRLIKVVQAGANRVLVIAPVASIIEPASDLSVNVGDMVAFAGSATDPDDTGLLAFSWDFNGVVPNSTVQNPGNITFNKAGVYVISLTATDGASMVSENPAQVTITVADSDANQAPSGLIMRPATDVTVVIGDSVDFVGGGIDPDGDLLAYSWDFAGLPEVVADTADPGIVVFPNTGVFQVVLTVTDALGLADPNPPRRTVTVMGTSPENSDFPTATILEPAEDMTILVGESVVFNGEAASPEGANDPVTVEWSMMGPDPAEDPVVFSTDVMPGEIPFDMAGEYTITFAATDAAGQTNQTPAEVVITVNDSPPANDPPPDELNGIIVSPDGDVSIKVGSTIDFVGDGIDPLGDGLIYDWTFGDPEIADVLDMQNPSATFNTEGEFEVTLTVTDAEGTVDSTLATLMVSVEPSGAESVIDSPKTDMTIVTGDQITFEGDAAGVDPLSFAWTTGDPDLDATVADLTAEEITVVFEMVGVYTVELTVTDANGVDFSPASVVITVEDAASPPPPAEPPVAPVPDPTAPADPPPAAADPAVPPPPTPGGIIEAPADDMTIGVGEAVEFIGSGTDPDGEDLAFQWQFDEAAPDSSAQSPGLVTFDQVGSFEVMLTVTNELGLVDPDPPAVTITVEAVAPAPASVAVND